MTRPNYPEDIGTELADLKRRLRALETAPSMQFTAQKGGRFELLSPLINSDLVAFGANSFGSYGAMLADKDGKIEVMVRDDVSGLAEPDLSMHFHAPTGTAVTAGSFTTMYEWQTRRLYHDAVVVMFGVVTDATGSGEVRIREVFSGLVTNTLVVPNNASNFAFFRWAHGLVDVSGQNALFNIEARQTGNNFTVFPPRYAERTSASVTSGCTATGNPALL